MNDQPPALSIRNLYKGFDGREVLRGIDIEVEKGKSLVIIGGSGSGKSVLLKCIVGILKPDRGEIFVNGRDVSRQTDADRQYMNRQSGMLFQGSALFDSLRVWENVAFRLLNAERKSRKTARAKAIECLSQVGLAPEVGDLSPAALSGGMQ
ncbi:MAG: ATP-binding cassette domain-containing protein [Parvularculaceae bacterium]